MPLSVKMTDRKRQFVIDAAIGRLQETVSSHVSILNGCDCPLANHWRNAAHLIGDPDRPLPDDAFLNISCSFMTPVDADNTRYFCFRHRNSDPDNAEMSQRMFEGARTAFVEDRDTLVGVHRGMKERRTKHINLGIDAGAMRFRKMVERRIEDETGRA